MRIRIESSLILAVLVAACGPGESGPGDCRALAQAEVASGASLPEGCYLVAEALTVESGTLSLEAGAQLRFAAGTALTISADGALRAAGTADKPVVFTGGDQSAGHWKGLRFAGSAGTDNALEHAVIEYAGGKWTGDARSVAAVFVENGTVLPVTHTTFRHNKGAALYATGGDGSLSVSAATFEDNELPALLHPNLVGGLAASNLFVGNAQSTVDVVLTNTNAVSTAQTWAALAIPLRVTDRFFVEAPLTLSAGLTIHFAQGTSMVVRNEGRLTAVGQSASPIVLRGDEAMSGYWMGVDLQTRGSANAFDYVTIEHAGSDNWTGNVDQKAAVNLGGASSLSIQNSTFRNSGHYALWVAEEAELTAFTNNTFEQNARIARIHPNRVGSVLPPLTATGNGEQAIRVGLTNTNAVIDGQTWRDLGVPFLVAERFYVEAPLTVEAGTEIQFLQDTSMRVHEAGVLRAEGTSTAQVRFLGHEATNGFWQGISISTSSTQNLLRYASIEHAGSSNWNGNAASVAALMVGLSATGRVALDNAAFRNSAGFGIYVQDGAVDPCTGAVFEGNGSGAIELTASGSTTCP